MRVAIILFGNYLHDGRVQRTAETINRNHEVMVFVTSDHIKNYPNIYNDVSIHLTNLKSKKLSNHPIIQVLKFIEYFIRTCINIRKFKPDIIFCNDVYTLFFGWYFKLKGKKFIYDSHELWKDTMHHYAYNKKLYKFLYWLQKKTINKADAVITVNEEIAEILQNDHTIPKPYVIMNINEAEGVSIEKSNLIHEKFNINPNNKIVLYIGGIAKGRGLDKIIESTQYWNDDIVFTLLGSGTFEQELRDLATKLGVYERVHFLGVVQQSEVLDFALACDIGIMAIQPSCLSYYYCLPNKFFQLTQLQKPILSSNFPELKKIVNKYNLGSTFDPTDPHDIANRVNELVTSKFKISAKDHKKFINDFNWKNESDKLETIITKMSNQ